MKPAVPSRRRYRLTVEYEGTAYRGWQVQANARTVQGVLIAAAEDLFAAPVDIQGAGRTDAGVHALGQTAHLVVTTDLPARTVRERLNDRLPANIHIREATETPPDFHARHSACGKSYLYVLSRERSAFGKRFLWWVREPLCVQTMERTAAGFVGFHDFSAFADRRIDRNVSSMVDVKSIEVRPWGRLVLIRIVGSHFLWKMVRRLVGILVEVGQGRLSEVQAGKLFTDPCGLPARCTAPPSGLYLEQVLYEGESLRPLEASAMPLFLFDPAVAAFRPERPAKAKTAGTAGRGDHRRVPGPPGAGTASGSPRSTPDRAPAKQRIRGMVPPRSRRRKPS